MEKKYINRFRSFQSSLASLEEARSRDMTDDFVVSGTVQKFCLTFDISWKVMKDIIVNYHKISDFAAGSPRETLRTAGSVRLISGDLWMKMLQDRNDLTHDYDGSLAREAVSRIVEWYLPKLEEFERTAVDYIAKMEQEEEVAVAEQSQTGRIKA